jgi:hypothetical protein
LPAATLFFALALLAFTFLSLAFLFIATLLLAALLSRFIRIALYVHITFRFYY